MNKKGKTWYIINRYFYTTQACCICIRSYWYLSTPLRKNAYISKAPFKIPTGKMYVGLRELYPWY